MPYQIYLFIFGLLVGSFLNVLSIRYRPGKRIFQQDRITGRSFCPNCKRTLAPLELIPLLSYVFLLGKCKSCKSKISPQYPIIELVTATITATLPIFIYKFFSFNFLLAQNPQLKIVIYIFLTLWLLVAYALVLMTLIDLKYRIIPDQLNLFIGIIAIIIFAFKLALLKHLAFNASFLQSYSQVFIFSQNIFLATTLALLVGTGFFALIIFLTKGRGMGLGDLKLIGPLAILVSWPDILILISAAFIFGSLIAVPLLLVGKKKLKDGIPFGPFLALAFFATIVLAQPLMSWYFSLI